MADNELVKKLSDTLKDIEKLKKPGTATALNRILLRLERSTVTEGDLSFLGSFSIDIGSCVVSETTDVSADTNINQSEQTGTWRTCRVLGSGAPATDIILGSVSALGTGSATAIPESIRLITEETETPGSTVYDYEY
ncbi:MAG: hypothetical protein ABEK36_04415 [Candidatus Aenigmatarchaeota archaeon]